ncbi:oligoendopeptidase F [Evansella vedderi]|uniref:Oligopeptidase F n=1 Tax=Evansella vedderi TaxID=38282 RepID=A0ABU0A3U1_9BACI|nr:oligoendopeptidase F [Evansella vedderi]MDQ0257915.1 oligoendopeptidase F [Evansella vedderi]
MVTYSSRAEVPENEKWDLTDIFPSTEEWKREYTKIEEMADKLTAFEGKIKDGNSLFEFLELREKINLSFKKVYVYAMLHVDLDTRDSTSQKLLDKASQLSVKVNSATSFFMPFLLNLKESTLKQYIAKVDKLNYFEDHLLDAYRYKDHVLSKEKEEVLSQLGEAISSPSKTYGMINNADIKFGEVTNEKGEKVELSRGMYSKLIEHEERAVRKEAYKAYYQPYVQLKNSIASTLSAAIKNNVVLTKMRNYPSALEKSLFTDMVSKDVYENLIQATKENIAPYHDYVTLRKKLLNLDEVRQYDLNVPLVKGVKHDIPYEEAYDTMLKALAPLGEGYVETLSRFRTKRYVDVRETPGKRSGAYNMGLYGVHPFVLLNHHDNIDSLFTLTHEMGHAMHSYYSSNYQPHITASYTIFVAEVASTVNEILLINYLLETTKDEQMRKYLVNHFIDKFRGTFFTQVMFAEFEKKTHELAEQGEPLNTQVFSEVYESLFREYNGAEVVFDDEVKYGWARIPHFYRPFYVYKYATGFASAMLIANKILEGDGQTKESYLEFLKSGSSDYPLELLKKTGVDLTKPEPVENALTTFRELVNQFSKM